MNELKEGHKKIENEKGKKGDSLVKPLVSKGLSVQPWTG
jgi:hypothetical protein